LHGGHPIDQETYLQLCCLRWHCFSVSAACDASRRAVMHCAPPHTAAVAAPPTHATPAPGPLHHVTSAAPAHMSSGWPTRFRSPQLLDAPAAAISERISSV